MITGIQRAPVLITTENPKDVIPHLTDRAPPHGTAILWPPLSADEPEEVGDICARASWFAGHLYDRILVPIDGPVASVRLPSYVSFAATVDLSKVRVCTVGELDALAGPESQRMYLVTRADVADISGPAQRATRFKGSIEVKGMEPKASSCGATYYYVGHTSTDLQDAYHWTCLTFWTHASRQETDVLEPSRRMLAELKVRASRYPRVAIFGTGPSLSEALDRDHSQALNIICNSIVKNRQFCDRLRPAAIVAADAHFHFSYHRYSAALLHDIVHQLRTSETVMFTFDKFATFLRHRIPGLAHKIFGIPAGRKEYGYDLDRDFRVQAGDSVLNMFLLPMASHLGDEIVLNGFTGRAASDTYFWSHSELHQYADRMADVRAAHVAFFAGRDYGGYADTVDQEIALRVDHARGQGKRVSSATRSFYTALANSDE